MDSIEKALKYAETGQRPVEIEEHEPTEIYAAIDNLRKNSKYFLDWWTATTEFRRSKLMRSNYVPVQSTEEEKNILININGDSSNASLS